MARLKLAVSLPSLGLPLRRGLEEAQRLGLGGLELPALGDLAPGTLSQTGRRELRHLFRSRGLELTALNCPLRHGLDNPRNLEGRIERLRQVMSLSIDLGSGLVIVQAGRVSGAGLLAESLQALAGYGDRLGATLALDTGLESGQELAAFLQRFDSGALAVNYDPANLLLGGFNPYDSLRALHGRVGHSHARDARQAGASREVPLGHGDIDWLLLLGIFEEIDYRGWLTIHRESGDQGLAAVAAGAAFLRRLGS